jgi:hypothetical protein
MLPAFASGLTGSDTARRHADEFPKATNIALAYVSTKKNR